MVCITESPDLMFCDIILLSLYLPDFPFKVTISNGLANQILVSTKVTGIYDSGQVSDASEHLLSCGPLRQSVSVTCCMLSQ